MDFYAMLDEVIELLRSRRRVSYRALTEHFGLDDERMDALRAELRYAHGDSVREDGQGLVWAPSESNPAGADNSRCCSAIWLARRLSPRSSIPRNSAK
jgi:hypothetical protein